MYGSSSSSFTRQMGARKFALTVSDEVKAGNQVGETLFQFDTILHIPSDGFIRDEANGRVDHLSLSASTSENGRDRPWHR